MQDDICDLHRMMEDQNFNAKDDFERSLRPTKRPLERPRGPPVPKSLFENALLYTSEVSRYADDCAREIRRIEERYDELCVRRKLHFGYRSGLWWAHFRLFRAGAHVSGEAFLGKSVGTHKTVAGEIETQVKLGSYVHVDEGNVYVDGCMPRIPGIEYDDDVPYGPRKGIIKIGELMDNINPECKSFSAIVWKKTYDRVDGLDDDDYMDEDTYDFRELHYELVVLGSSEVLLYDQWDTIYSPLKEYVRRMVIDADSSDDDDDEVFDADSSDEEDDA